MEELKNDGVTVLHNILDNEQIQATTHIYNKYYSIVKELKDSNKIIQNTQYRIHINKEDYLNKNYYQDKDITIIELKEGKYDFSIPNLITPPSEIVKLVEKFLKQKKYKIINGFLSSSGISQEGDLHRDTLNLNSGNAEEEEFDDTLTIKHLKPFYFTVLIPLVDLNKDNGSTKFILGSHKKCYKEVDLLDFTQYDINVGSAIIFDGRIMHKAGENKTLGDRPIMYYVFHKDWYNENY
ncbi:Phytanoyl-CoA dioxygenase (PhyH) [seawater metagenome]|uniref:Phytanoyl-CoA dioxygenase (PhyH) n=1 Tax=seawater metagenome TaxID=1561972 RepID=A0A5E8CMK1_9ZZZZ